MVFRMAWPWAPVLKGGGDKGAFECGVGWEPGGGMWRNSCSDGWERSQNVVDWDYGLFKGLGTIFRQRTKGLGK